MRGSAGVPAECPLPSLSPPPPGAQRPPKPPTAAPAQDIFARLGQQAGLPAPWPNLRVAKTAITSMCSRDPRVFVKLCPGVFALRALVPAQVGGLCHMLEQLYDAAGGWL